MDAQKTIAPNMWSINHEPAANTQATITQAAVANGRHFITSISGSCVGDVAAASIVFLRLRAGASGAGTILWSCAMRGTITSGNVISISGLNIELPTNTAATLEFSGAGGAGSQETVALTGYTLTRL